MPAAPGRPLKKRPAAASDEGAAKLPANLAAAKKKIVEEVVAGIDLKMKPDGKPTSRKFVTDKAYAQGKAKAEKKDMLPFPPLLLGRARCQGPSPPAPSTTRDVASPYHVRINICSTMR